MNAASSTVAARERLTVIIPTLNEGPCIELVLEGVLAVEGVDEVLVVDGNSTDGTRERVEAVIAGREPDATPKLRMFVQSRPGFGPALWEAFERAEGELLCIVDADGSHDWRDIPTMRALIDDGADYVMGSRYKGPFRYRGPLRWPWSTSDDDDWTHEVGNVAIVAAARLLHGYPLSDVMMGLQMWRRSNFDHFTLEEPTQAFEAELKLKTLHAGLKMVEIPTHEHPRIGGDAKLDAWFDGRATFRVIGTIWLEQVKKRWRKQ